MQVGNVIHDITQAPDWLEHVLTRSTKVQKSTQRQREKARAKSACSLVECLDPTVHSAGASTAQIALPARSNTFGTTFNNSSLNELRVLTSAAKDPLS